MQKSLISLSIALSVVLFISSCGSSGNSSTTQVKVDDNISSIEQEIKVSSIPDTTTSTPAPLIEESISTGTGYYIDSAVDGISYSCGLSEGVTDKNGKFTFEVGEDCTFSINDIILRVIESDYLSDGKKIIEDDIKVAQFLQSLDNDGDASNGITITKEVIEVLSQNGMVKLPENETELKATIKLLDDAKDSGDLEYKGKFVNQSDAQAHIDETKESLEEKTSEEEAPTPEKDSDEEPTTPLVEKELLPLPTNPVIINPPKVQNDTIPENIAEVEESELEYISQLNDDESVEYIADMVSWYQISYMLTKENSPLVTEYAGAKIEYISDKDGYISSNGIITEPLNNEEVIDINLSIKVTKGDSSFTKDFGIVEVMSQKNFDDKIVNYNYDYIFDYINSYMNATLTQFNTPLDLYSEMYNTTVILSSDKDGYISSNGEVNIPTDENVDVNLSVNISKGEADITRNIGIVTIEKEFDIVEITPDMLLDKVFYSEYHNEMWNAFTKITILDDNTMLVNQVTNYSDETGAVIEEEPYSGYFNYELIDNDILAIDSWNNFTLLEQNDNNWSMVSNNGEEVTWNLNKPDYYPEFLTE